MLSGTENCSTMKANSDLQKHNQGESVDNELPEVSSQDRSKNVCQSETKPANNEQLSHSNNSNQSDILKVEEVTLNSPAYIKNNSIDELLQKVSYQQNVIEQNTDTIRFIEEKCAKLETFRKDIEHKLETAIKQKDAAIKEKENIVIRYAVGENNVLKERQQKEQAEKKYKDLHKEYELLQHKLQTMISEKSRICQMLDNKCYEYKNVQLEFDKAKQDLNNLETKLKWNQNSLKNEIEAHREIQARADALNAKVQDSVNQIEAAKKSAEETVKNFMTSQENRAYVLDQQVKEQQATLILLRHEKSDKDQHVKSLQSELERLQSKHKEIIEENNNLSLKVQHLERERLENEQKLSELRGYQDLQRQDAANLQTKNVQFEQVKLQLKHEEEQLQAANEQIERLKERNQEIESDMDSCRVREAELLVFTQQLTDKNVRLQSEFTAVETKVQQLSCEQTVLKRQLKEHETRISILNSTLEQERSKNATESESLTKNLKETQNKLDVALRDVADQQGENLVMKRKFDLSMREVNKELHHCRRKLEHYEAGDSSTNSSNSSSSLNVNGHAQNLCDTEHVKVIQPEPTIDKQTLIEHIVKLQRISAKKSEKIDFLEEHVNNLVSEIQKKTKLLQGYVLREQAGTLSSNSMDNNKAQLAKLNGVMASLYSSRVCDQNLTLELSLDINRKLQAVLEDALLKNITLKENVDTLGAEIDRLNQILKK
ncbi:hypothetical protein HUJ04_006644 [Dendroctonus ponderosae]|uniref:Coiled-coil domain-containing protein 186 n=3 Tax=Dendroctonus ponderosae TaxID=77166 RepID=A0AAR5QI58_DENPD|nr:hypothetical protein HUJ04_003296 [Dendroctonus ponderosae]KAH1005713.1 hypothetical protein HUJ04_006644 [Dendroctonus ponderosae]